VKDYDSEESHFRIEVSGPDSISFHEEDFTGNFSISGDYVRCERHYLCSERVNEIGGPAGGNRWSRMVLASGYGGYILFDERFPRLLLGPIEAWCERGRIDVRRDGGRVYCVDVKLASWRTMTDTEKLQHIREGLRGELAKARQWKERDLMLESAIEAAIANITDPEALGRALDMLHKTLRKGDAWECVVGLYLLWLVSVVARSLRSGPSAGLHLSLYRWRHGHQVKETHHDRRPMSIWFWLLLVPVAAFALIAPTWTEKAWWLKRPTM
jgi:hypothetical protein